ncbi:uncharacterized protein LOC143445110 isoform X2 [Clavelina lepadiformis]|uniref:uncharacterized protein LOC143445110 isoform X2 n=1 Tax=Clavelina lepadiformis TaxID=159417 RepID=UPI0040417063
MLGMDEEETSPVSSKSQTDDVRNSECMQGPNGDVYVLSDSAKPLKAILDQRAASQTSKPHRTIKQAHEIVKLVDLWLGKSEDYKEEVTHISFVLLMSDFLFSQIALSPKWLGWASRLKMIELKCDPEEARSEHLQQGYLAEHQIIVIKMLFAAHSKMQELGKYRYHLIGLLEFINQVEMYEESSLTRALNVARGQEQIKQICDSLSDISMNYSSDEKPDKSLDMSMYAFAKSYERKVFAALLVGRALSETMTRALLEGQDVIKARNQLYHESGKATILRIAGNQQFQQKEFDLALNTYSQAIDNARYSAVLYCNRCQTALKLKQFRFAISDGYRAIALNPWWGKAYYRHAEALRGDNQIDVAIDVNAVGLEMCFDSSEKQDLKRQKQKLEQLKRGEIPDDTQKIPLAPVTKKAKKSKKGKKKKSEQQPASVSEDESVKSVSEPENNVDSTKNGKSTNGKKGKKQDKTERRLSQTDKKTEEKTSKPKQNASKQNQGKSSKKINLTDDKKKKADKSKQSTEDGPKMGKDTKKFAFGDIFRNPDGDDDARPRPKTVSELYHEYKVKASVALMIRDYQMAYQMYSFACKTMDEALRDPSWQLPMSEQFMAFYALGMSTLREENSYGAMMSMSSFERLTDPFRVKEVFHPMAYYAVSKAQYLLNNFPLVIKPAQLGLKLLTKRKNNFPVLKWPGIEEEVSESKSDILLKLLEDLINSRYCVLRPDAVCSFKRCGKDERKNKDFLLCEKDMFRNEIYFTDYNYEGFVRIICTWNCASAFHYKCWSKYKHSIFKKSGDKDVLDRSCKTDGCMGNICRIVMFDKENSIKKDIESDKPVEKTKEKNIKSKKKPVPMSKSELNLEKRRMKTRQAKLKKEKYKLDRMQAKRKQEEASTKKPVKPVQVFTEMSDLTNATIIKRDENEDDLSIKSKHKPRAKKKTRNALSLQEFLGGFKRGLSMADVEEAISSCSEDAPFLIPEELRSEIKSFEENFSEISAEEMFRITMLYQYFEHFFEQNGPFLVHDDLFLQQSLLLPEEMQIIVNKNGIIPFLTKNKDKFILLSPYIGLTRQIEIIEELRKDLQKSIEVKPRSVSDTQREQERSASSLDTLDMNFDNPCDLSDFARDLYKIGEVPIEDVQAITSSRDPAYQTDSWNEVGRGGHIYKPAPTEGIARATGRQVVALSSRMQSTPPVSTPPPTNDEKLLQQVDSFLNVNRAGEGRRMSQLSETSSSKSSRGGASSEAETSSIASASQDANDEEEIITSTGVQTELIPSYVEEIQKLVNEKELLETRLEEINDKFTRLKATSRTELAAAKKELKEGKDALMSTQKRALAATQQAENELKKIAKDRATWNENMKNMKAQLQDANGKVFNLQTQLNGKEVEFDRISRILQEQRSAWLDEKMIGEREREKLLELLQQTRERAMEAELQTLSTEECFGLKILTKARTECERITAELEKLGRAHAHNPSAQREVLNAFLKWKSNIDTCTRLIEQTRKQFAEHAESIKEGKTLSELTAIRVPTPPSPGPSLQQVAIAAMRAPNIGGPPVPLTSFSLNGLVAPPPPPPTPPPPTLDSQPVSTTSQRTLQPPIGTGKQSAPPARSTNTPSKELPTTSHSKGSFEKIMHQLQELFPNVTRTELALCIKEVRQTNNNSLTGLSLDDIVQQASQIVHKKGLVRKTISSSAPNVPSPSVMTSSQPVMSTSQSIPPMPPASPPVPSIAPWYHSRGAQSRIGGIANVNDDEPCVICHDPLKSMEVHRLLCGHIFHNDCLAKWLERNRTCPTCRDYAIDTSEYPPLCNAIRR